jgi:hypothetical protein
MPSALRRRAASAVGRVVVAATCGGLVCGLVAGCDARVAPLPTPPAAGTTDTGRADITPPAVRPEPTPTEATTTADTAAPKEITFDDIKLDLEKGAPFRRDVLTERVHALDGRRVRIRGYILPSFQQSGLTQFVLVRDNQECCFGPGAALHDCVVVRMQPGRTATFSIRPVAVAGTFRVDELRGPDGRHLAIYALDGENVQ